MTDAPTTPDAAPAAKPADPNAALGTALPLPVRSGGFVQRLATRRSGPAQALTAPGPANKDIAAIITLGARTPDHGKLFPWRFVVIGPETRAKVVERLTQLADKTPKPEKAKAALAKMANPPCTIMVVSAPVPDSHPQWEQVLSAGAVCMNLIHAANALGFATSWITDWYAYDAEATKALGIGPKEKIAGFIHIGTLAEAPLERPRPDLKTRVRVTP